MNSNINVWMLTKWYPNREDPQLGVFIQKHARAIAIYHNISVLYIHSSSAGSEKFEINISESAGVHEVIVYYKKDNSHFRTIINTFRYLTSFVKGIRVMKEHISSPDLIHAYILTRTGVLAWYLSFIKRIPFIISEQWSGFITGKFLQGGFLRIAVTRFVTAHAMAVTAVSQVLERNMKLCGLSNKNYRVIPNIIERPPSPDRNQKGNNTIIVLLVADLIDEIKNISGVIRMIGKLQIDLNFELHIIGGGRDEDALKKLAGDLDLLNKKVFFEGLRKNEEVYEYLDACDFLVMNSNFETFSLICVEAMSCGKPVLATRCGGPEEYIDKTSGILIQPENDDELKQNFVYMLTNFRNFDPVKIKEYANTLFSKEKAALQFKKLFNEIVRPID